MKRLCERVLEVWDCVSQVFVVRANKKRMAMFHDGVLHLTGKRLEYLIFFHLN
jgi:hypothetical protein